MVNSFADNLTISLFISRLIFAVIWYLIALIHGDLEPDNLPQNQVIINSVKSVDSAELNMRNTK